MATMLEGTSASTRALYAAEVYHESAAATEPRALGWHGVTVWRWRGEDSTRSRNVARAFTGRVLSTGPHSVESLHIMPEHVSDDLFLASPSSVSLWRREIFRRIAKGPSSLEDASQNATIQEFEDPGFSGRFRSAFAEPLARLSALARLQQGWDSYGAPPIEARAVQHAGRFLSLLYKRNPGIQPPLVGPSPSGGVVLQWYRPDLEVFVEIADDACEYYSAQPEEAEVQEQRRVGVEQMSDLIALVASLLQ